MHSRSLTPILKLTSLKTRKMQRLLIILLTVVQVALEISAYAIAPKQTNCLVNRMQAPG